VDICTVHTHTSYNDHQLALSTSSLTISTARLNLAFSLMKVKSIKRQSDVCRHFADLISGLDQTDTMNTTAWCFVAPLKIFGSPCNGCIHAVNVLASEKGLLSGTTHGKEQVMMAFAYPGGSSVGMDFRMPCNSFTSLSCSVSESERDLGFCSFRSGVSAERTADCTWTFLPWPVRV
jgi:hypothetical protein